MLIDKINFTQSELNAGTTVKDIANSGTSAGYVYPRNYRTSSVQVANGSGAAIHFNLLTTIEYNAWVIDPAISDLIPVANASSINISSLQGKLTKAICSGTTGHSAGVDIVCIQETP